MNLLKGQNTQEADKGVDESKSQILSLGAKSYLI
jgi:hypothetical protein